MVYIIYGTERDIERNELGVMGSPELSAKEAANIAMDMLKYNLMTSIVEDVSERKVPVGYGFIKSFWNRDYLEEKLKEAV